MKAKRLYFMSGWLIVMPLLFFGCGGNGLETNKEAKYHITPLQYSLIGQDDVEQLIESEILVDLEFNENSLMHTLEKILVLDNGDFIVTDKKKICHFDSKGKHIRNYGMVGRGPQEFVSIADICLDEAGDALIILDPMSKVLFFSTESGAFIKSFSPDWEGDGKRVDGILPSSGGNFYIISANTTLRKPGDEFYCLTEFDSKGRKVSEGLPTTDFVYMNSLVSQSYDDRNLIKPLDNSNITYEVKDGRIIPLCWIDFGDKNVETGAAFMPDGAMFFPKLIETNSYKIPMSFAETESHISFIVAGPKGQAYGYIYSKVDDNGYCIASPDREKVPITFSGSDREYLYTVMDKYSPDGMEEFADPITRYLIEKYGILGEKDNQRIIGIKFK